MPPSHCIRSRCVPSSATLPSEMMAILSASWIVESRCAIIIVVLFFCFSSLSRAACTTLSDAESKAEVASSKIRIAGSRTNARAMATRCFWPPES
mmetsp:Transcript_79764/g.125794  ORF Transcript_79764/g.125794 Transcript_79764/m.125794 type:complete len:95 (+) Transcript_79764:311-595(+)